MPHSLPEGKDWLAKRYVDIAPNVVLDLGVGSGTYADLLRPLDAWTTHWIGYEIWIPYAAHFGLRSKYDALIIQDVREAKFPPVDLIIAGDVLEHMTKPEALAIIGRMKLAARHVFVSLPIVHYAQGEVGGNPHEAHVHHWAFAEMLAELADDRGDLECFQGAVIGAYHWSQDVE